MFLEIAPARTFKTTPTFLRPFHWDSFCGSRQPIEVNQAGCCKETDLLAHGRYRAKLLAVHKC